MSLLLWSCVLYNNFSTYGCSFGLLCLLRLSVYLDVWGYAWNIVLTILDSELELAKEHCGAEGQPPTFAATKDATC